MQTVMGVIVGAAAGFGLCYLTVAGRGKKLHRDVGKVLDEYSRGNVLKEMDTAGYGAGDQAILKPLGALHQMLKNWVYQIVRSSSIISRLTQELNEDSHASLKEIAQLSSKISDFSADAYQVSNDIMEAASISEELSSGSAEIATAGRQVQERTTKTKEVVDIGGEAIEKAIRVMNEIGQKLEGTGDELKKLDQMMNNITGMSVKINKIAEQINLLSLNASIEAARAGEAGRGFTIVAQEIGKLADESAGASSEISRVVEGIMGQMNATHDLMESGVRQGQEGQQVGREAREKLSEIMKAMEEILEAIGHISTVTGEQSEATEQLATHIEKVAAFSRDTMSTLEQINGMMEQQNAYIEKSTQKADELYDISHGLGEFGGQFDEMLGRCLVRYSQGLAEEIKRKGIQQVDLAQFARKTGAADFYVTDETATIVASSDKLAIGFQFPDDPNSQAYDFLKILKDPKLQVIQKMQPRDLDNEYYKFAGISRSDAKGIVQASLAMRDIPKFHIRMDL